MVTVGQQTNNLFLETFKTQDFAEDGSPAWIMNGKDATVVGSKVKLKETVTDLFNKTGKVTVFTVESVYNQDTKIWSSEKNVKITSDNMKVTGIGFILDTVTKTVHINKKVKVTLNSLKALRIEHDKK